MTEIDHVVCQVVPCTGHRCCDCHRAVGRPELILFLQQVYVGRQHVFVPRHIVVAPHHWGEHGGLAAAQVVDAATVWNVAISGNRHQS